MCSIISLVLGRFIHLYWTIPKKKETRRGWGGDGRVEDMERNSNWIFRGLMKSIVEFP